MRTARLLPVSPSMHCSGGGVPGLGVYLVWGVYLPGGCTCPGVYLVRGCTCSRGVYLPRGEGGVPAPGGVYLPGGVPAQVPPLPPWTEWQTGAGGKNDSNKF